jgi:hypothetical protein
MKTTDLDKLLHALKPDGHHCSPLATELHKLANALQVQADQAHAALHAVLSPTFKGEVTGVLAEWPGHFPLELDHSEGSLNDILVRGTSVSEHLAPGLWEEAEAYAAQRYAPEPGPALRRTVARMDAADLRAAQAA